MNYKLCPSPLDQTQTGWTGGGKSTFCHPERSEGSAFLLGFQETADSSGKPRPSEWHRAIFSATCEACPTIHPRIS